MFPLIDVSKASPPHNQLLGVVEAYKYGQYAAVPNNLEHHPVLTVRLGLGSIELKVGCRCFARRTISVFDRKLCQHCHSVRTVSYRDFEIFLPKETLADELPYH